jgi:hypothetical protein
MALTTGVGGTIPLTVISANAQGDGTVATVGNHFGGETASLRSVFYGGWSREAEP